MVETSTQKSFLTRTRENPWIISTFVLGVLFLVTLVFFANPSITGNVINEQDLGNKVLGYAVAQGVSGATIDSVKRDGNAYTVTVDVNGQKVPLLLSLDGNYLLQPLIADGLTGGTQTAPNEPVEIDNSKIADAPFKGNADAPITIIEFSDYQCPFCERAYQTLKQVEQEYVATGKAKIVYLNYPLSFHPEAEPAAQAALCYRKVMGGSNDAYFKYHDKLFDNQETLNEENYKKWAVELGANAAQFNSCYDTNEFSSLIQAELAYGSSLGVTGTPGFFINGVELVGAQPYSAFKQVIDAELAKLA